jgi:hypothetical protein
MVEYENIKAGRRTFTSYRQYINAWSVAKHKVSRNGEPTSAQQRLVAIGERYSYTVESIVAVTSLCSSRKQQQAIVQWAPCVQPGWQIEIQQSSGYKVRHMREATPSNLEEHALDELRPCEYCTTPAVMGEHEHQKCTVCARWYHTECIQRVHGEAPVDISEMFKCVECKENQYTIDNLPHEVKLFRVEWEEAPEAIPTIRASATQEALQQLYARLAEKLAEQPAQDNGAPKRQKTTAQPRPRITPSDTERVYDVTISHDICKKLVLHTLPINPHADIDPEERGTQEEGCLMYMRPVQYATPSGKIRSKELCCIYGADGRCEHMISHVVVARLKDAYMCMQTNHPDTMESMQAGTFTEELRRLVLRYRPSPGTKVTEAQHWGLPAQLKHAIMRKCKLTKERFSNPLVAHPCTPSYWTAHERD